MLIKVNFFELVYKVIQRFNWSMLTFGLCGTKQQCIFNNIFYFFDNVDLLKSFFGKQINNFC